MASSRILSSKAVNKLQVNRLDAQAIRSDDIIPQSPSYLFSAVFNNGNFTRDSSGGTLTFTRNDIDSIIEFSDRPFRQTDNIDYETFISLFDISDSGSNTFAQDPPNGVLVHEEEQRTYIIRLLNSDTDSATFSLELLPGESHNLSTVSGRLSLFVDNKKKNVRQITSITFRYVTVAGTTTDTWAKEKKVKSIEFTNLDKKKNVYIQPLSKLNIDDIISRLNKLGSEVTIQAKGINPFEMTDTVNTFNFEKSKSVLFQQTDTKIVLGYYVYDTPLSKSDNIRITLNYE